jgi:hypothetical protein
MATPTPSLAVFSQAVRARQAAPLHKPWQLPPYGLAVFHGETPHLSHYFLPRLLLAGKRVLFLDGANCADPRLLERLARQRNVPFTQFNQQIQIARAFTCFQLTELIARVPQFLADFPAQVLIVTAFPELYFDEDIRDWDARVAFERALTNLRRLASVAVVYPSRLGADDRRSAGPACGTGIDGADPARGVGATVASPLAVAVFSATPRHSGLTSSPIRRHFFNQLCAAASEVWKFSRGVDNRLGLTCERAITGATSALPPRRVQAPERRYRRGVLWVER